MDTSSGSTGFRSPKAKTYSTTTVTTSISSRNEAERTVMAAPGATRATKYERMDGFEDGCREPKREAWEPDQPVTAFPHV